MIKLNFNNHLAKFLVTVTLRKNHDCEKGKSLLNADDTLSSVSDGKKAFPTRI